MEHITQHMKAHAQNDAEFRALIGEPKMGKVTFDFLLQKKVRDSIDWVVELKQLIVA